MFIRYINYNTKEYDIVDASITNMRYVGRDVYSVTVQYVYNNQNKTERVAHRLGDYIGKKIPLAINVNTDNSFRMQVTISYMHISSLIAGFCLLLIEFLRYKDEKKRYLIRKVKDMNDNK